MNNKEIVKLKNEELEENKLKLKETLITFNLDNARNELKDTSQFKKTKLEIARIETELTKRRKGDDNDNNCN